jgi:AcrR family transcriptional regulator
LAKINKGVGFLKNESVNRRKNQAAETRKKLFDSAVKLFNKYDFADVSVDSIVEAAGVSKGTFYVHFESKDTLIASIISDYVRNIDLDYKSYLDSLAYMPASDILVALAGKISDVLINTIGYDNMKIVYTLQLTKTVNTEDIRNYNRALYAIFSDVLGKGIEQEEFKAELPLDTLTKHFVMAIRGLAYEWCIRYPDFDLKQQVLMHFEMLLSGIKSRR